MATLTFSPNKAASSSKTLMYKNDSSSANAHLWFRYEKLPPT